MLILDILFKPLNYLSKIVDSINHLVGIAVAWLTVLMVINVFVVVVLRYVFSIGFVWLQELYVWSHAAVFLLGAGYTLLHEGHVRIDVIYRKSSVSYKSIVNILGIIIFAIPLLYLIFEKSWPLISRSWENLERSAEAVALTAASTLAPALDPSAEPDSVLPLPTGYPQPLAVA